MKELSIQLQRLPASMTLAVSDKAKALQRAGHDVIALAGGDPDFATPEHITQAAFEAIQKGATHYPAPMKGIPALLEAIGAKMERENGVRVDPGSEIVVTPGAKWALALALNAIVNPGDEVLYFEPAWVSYRPLIQLAGATPVPVSLDADDNFAMNVELIRRCITPRTKALLINTPCNPSGRVMSRREILELAALVLEHDLYVIADEIYEKLIFDGLRHFSLAAEPGMGERTLTVNGFSKAYAMTGWRLGWLSGPAAIIKLATKLNGQTVSSAANFTMHAGVAALTGPQDEVVAMCQAYQMRRDFMVDALNAMPGIDCPTIEGAFYLFPRFTHTQRGNLELADALLDLAGIAATPGIAFGSNGEKHLRFSIATSYEELERAVERLAKVATQL